MTDGNKVFHHPPELGTAISMAGGRRVEMAMRAGQERMVISEERRVGAKPLSYAGLNPALLPTYISGTVRSTKTDGPYLTIKTSRSPFLLLSRKKQPLRWYLGSLDLIWG